MRRSAAAAVLAAALLARAAAPPAVVERHAPLLRLHPEERFGPMRVREFLAGSTLRWGRKVVARQGTVRAARLGERCEEAPRGCYRHAGVRADELTRPIGGGSDAEGFALDVDDALYAGSRGNVPIHWELRRSARGVTITYWLFYGYDEPVLRFENPPPGADPEEIAARLAHEGDWERVVVVLSPALEPRGVRFHQHEDFRNVPWERVTRAAGGHPVVWVARGKHASYARPGVTRDCLTPRACLVDERADGGRTVRTWRAGLTPVRSRGWYGFGGAWGRVGELSETTGPLGPSRWKR
jgi:hypothetical protein